MPGSARVGDISVGICCCHVFPLLPLCIPWVGICVTGASTASSENSLEARIGDVFIGCHPQVAVTGSLTSLIEGSPSSRIGDTTVGCTVGTIVSGAATVIIGG